MATTLQGINFTPKLHSTDFLLSTFEFERQKIAGCCKQTFCVQFSSKAKHYFFSFLSGLLNFCKNSNFFKISPTSYPASSSFDAQLSISVWAGI